MSLQTTLDLAKWTMSDLFGSLISQESQITILKNQVGGHLALVGKAFDGSSHKDKAGKKKLLTVESDEDDNSEDEVDMKSIMKSVTLITREYNRGFR